jgi:cellulose synthase/poly-beta-1,6-N-acetylglucosamine synthase-like glycosyltransferase
MEEDILIMQHVPRKLNLPQLSQAIPPTRTKQSQFKAPLRTNKRFQQLPSTPVPPLLFDTSTSLVVPEHQVLQQPYAPPSITSPGFGLPKTPHPKDFLEAVPQRHREHVARYDAWLTHQAKQDVLIDKHSEMNEYISYANQTVRVTGKDVATFAPFRAELSALQTFTRTQIIALSVLAFLFILGIVFFRVGMLATAISAITILYFSDVLLSMFFAARSLQSATAEKIEDGIVHGLKDSEWPPYTILCPLYKEAQVVPQFVQAMQALDYPSDKLQILFLTETDDRATRDAIRAMNLPPHFKIVTVPDGKPRTKPRACNYGLMQTMGTYVVIFDAEDVPDPLQLKKAVLTFANNEANVACVQAKLNFYNIQQNFLTRWFTVEYTTWFDLILPGLQKAKFSLPLGGTSNHFRTSALRALGAWDAYNVTEDCDLGLRLSRYHLRTVVLDSTTYEEANSQVKNWIRQRSRWIKGYMQTYLVHMRNPMEFLRKGRLYELLSFQIVVGCGIGFIFLNPLMWLLLLLYLLIGPSILDVYHQLFPGLTLYMAEFCLIFGNFFYIYLYLFGCVKRKQYDLMLWAALIPMYWLLMTIAGMVAFYELLVKPHYWQKTVHGLHLHGSVGAQSALQQQVVKSVADEQTVRTAIAVVSQPSVGVIPTVSHSFRAMSTMLLPALSQTQKQQRRKTQQVHVRDVWFFASMAVSCVASVLACIYYLSQHEITLYQDALSHMRISRSVFDNATPGLAQLGTVWLPLPHMLMWSFIWNNALWHSGLAGSFVSMPCYVIASIYLFLAAKRLTKSSSASFIGVLAFALNPNILYLQATPLSETVCIATLAMTCYYFLCWTQENASRFLIFAAGCTFLSTLARYDGWALFVAMLCLIPIVGLRRRQRFVQIQSNLILFGGLGGLGIVLWLVWNKLLFGDPLYFQHSGVYSSQAQQMLLLKQGEKVTFLVRVRG